VGVSQDIFMRVKSKRIRTNGDLQKELQKFPKNMLIAMENDDHGGYYTLNHIYSVAKESLVSPEKDEFKNKKVIILRG
jgi:hypothetical protein